MERNETDTKFVRKDFLKIAAESINFWPESYVFLGPAESKNLLIFFFSIPLGISGSLLVWKSKAKRSKMKQSK